MKKQTKNILIGAGVLAATVMAFRLFKKNVATRSLTELQNSTWRVNGVAYPGSHLNIQQLPDGRFQIGDGYIGNREGDTIITTERNGIQEDPITWVALPG